MYFEPGQAFSELAALGNSCTLVSDQQILVFTESILIDITSFALCLARRENHLCLAYSDTLILRLEIFNSTKSKHLMPIQVNRNARVLRGRRSRGPFLASPNFFFEKTSAHSTRLDSIN